MILSVEYPGFKRTDIILLIVSISRSTCSLIRQNYKSMNCHCKGPFKSDAIINEGKGNTGQFPLKNLILFIQKFFKVSGTKTLCLGFYVLRSSSWI